MSKETNKFIASGLLILFAITVLTASLILFIVPQLNMTFEQVRNIILTILPLICGFILVFIAVAVFSSNIRKKRYYASSIKADKSSVPDEEIKKFVNIYSQDEENETEETTEEFKKRINAKITELEEKINSLTKQN